MKIVTSKITTLLIALSLVGFMVVGCGSATTADKSAPTPAAPTQNAPTPAPAEKPAEHAAPAVTYKDGTYDGESLNGIDGAIKVQITVASGKISEVKVTEQHETPDVGGKALEMLPAEIVKAQSTQIDAIAGATATTDAFKEAIESALEKAK